MSTAAIGIMPDWRATGFAPSRPALALVVIVHACCIFALAKLIDAHRVASREPLIVELLEPPRPEEVEKPPPKKKLPEPRLEEPPPQPKESPPPKVEAPPPPELPRPDVPPQPLAQADIAPPPMPIPVPQPVVQQPVVRQPVTPVIEPPSRPAPPPQAVREKPLPPIRIAQVPVPLEAPRLPDPTLKVERDVPEARPVALAPREPARRPIMDLPAVAAPVHAPVPEAAPEPQPQVTVLPEPPPGASTEVLDEISLGAEMLRANYLRNPKPLYPALSRRLKEQGTVLLRVFVTAAGQPTEVILKTSSGFPRLDNAAQQAVTGWKFVPATREEKPVEAWVIVPIKFSLAN